MDIYITQEDSIAYEHFQKITNNRQLNHKVTVRSNIIFETCSKIYCTCPNVHSHSKQPDHYSWQEPMRHGLQLYTKPCLQSVNHIL